jgi:DNA polymerase I-like protein with 3'-5' exonuclease and polymerase domains
MTDVLQMPLYEMPSKWQLPDLGSMPNWKDAKRIGIDVETKDPKLKQLGIGVRRDGEMVGISFTIEDGPSYYLPYGHLGGDNLLKEHVLAYITDQAKEFNGTLVFAHADYDLDYLIHNGITFPKCRWIRDVQISDPLINELHFRYSLEAISERLGLPGKDETDLIRAAAQYGIPKAEVKRYLWKLPAKYVGEYAAWDSKLPLIILRRHEKMIDEQELWPIFDLESRVTPALVAMRRRGVRIDFDALQRVEDWSIVEEQKALNEIHRRTGIRIKLGDVWAKPALIKALEIAGIILPNTAKGDKKIDQALLSAAKNPVADLIMRARKVNKLRTTFVNSIRVHAIGDRVHCTFNQMRTTDDAGGSKGVRFGRLSSDNPCLQQQPARDDFATFWRKIYVPDEGCKWLSADISQHEPRMILHYGELCNLPGTSLIADQWRENPNMDNYDFLSTLIFGSADKKHRDNTKRIYLGLCYGMGGGKLAKQLGLPTEIKIHKANKNTYLAAGSEAQKIIDRFNDRVPFLRRLARQCEEKARKRGYVKTILGRRCRFPQNPDGSYDWCHKAFSRVIQGSCADQVKLALAELHENNMPQQLQIHDEIDASVESNEQALQILDIMRNGVPLKVPLRIDNKQGPSWGEAKSG